MGYFSYYIAFILLAWLVQHPALLLGVVAVFVLRRFIPDPWVYLRTFRRIGALRQQIDANPANVTARRDLARIELERRRPRTALKLLDEARRRDGDSAELLYLTGLARLRAGRAEEALEPLVAAVQKDPRVSFGEAYLVAGDALSQLGRHEEAVDAYERYTAANSSSIQGYTKLALAQRAAGEGGEAKTSLAEGLRTFGQLPSYRRRKELGWFLRAQLYRLYV